MDRCDDRHRSPAIASSPETAPARPTCQPLLPAIGFAQPTSSAGLTDTVLLSKGDDTKWLRLSSAECRQPAATRFRTYCQPETGTRIGTYFLQEKLGEGVSCHVFRGTRTRSLRARWR